MTWRGCSPPWPGRPQNPVSWPGRRQCGLPSAGRPPRPVSQPLPGGQGGAGGPGRSRVRSSFPGQAGHGAGRGGGRAGQRPSRPTSTCCPAPFSNWPTWPSRAGAAPHRSSSRQAATLGTARPAPRKVQPSSQPAPRRTTRRAPPRAPVGDHPCSLREAAERRCNGRSARHARPPPAARPRPAMTKGASPTGGAWCANWQGFSTGGSRCWMAAGARCSSPRSLPPPITGCQGTIRILPATRICSI